MVARCGRNCGDIFPQVLDDIRGGQEDNARNLLLNLREPNETRLGYSTARPRGAGIGSEQAEEIFEALRTSARSGRDSSRRWRSANS
jgi:hypothetical protein